MDNCLGNTIGQLRKARKITQEQLAAYVGVSAQAVSKWENGGTPDCELLPKIADYLEISIDALFHREYETKPDLKRAVAEEIAARPQEERFAPVMEYLWTLQSALTGDTSQKFSYAEMLELRKNPPSYSQMLFDSGISLMSLNKNLPYFLCMPEPDSGWLKSFAKAEEYCALFSFLGERDCFDAVLLLYSIKPYLFNAGLLQTKLGLTDARTDELLSLLEKNRLLTVADIETEKGAEKIYHFHPNPALIGILTLAIEMISPPHNFSNYNNSKQDRNFLQPKTADPSAG